MRWRAYCLTITMAIPAAPLLGAGWPAHAQAISPMQAPAPIGRKHPAHSREWYVQNGYRWNGRSWEMAARGGKTESSAAAALTPTTARAQAETPPPQPQQR